VHLLLGSSGGARGSARGAGSGSAGGSGAGRGRSRSLASTTSALAREVPAAANGRHLKVLGNTVGVGSLRA